LELPRSDFLSCPGVSCSALSARFIFLLPFLSCPHFSYPRVSFFVGFQESWPAIRTILLLEGWITDASILLDLVDGFSPEKEAFPDANSLRVYEFIDVIKATLEKECPLTVSCTDIIALSARDVIRMVIVVLDFFQV
jgi:hypothetical protein